MSTLAIATAREVFDLLRDDLVAIEQELGRDAASSVSTITEIAEYLREGGGKRIRPSLLLLASLGLASAAPSTPGYVGIYQFVAVTVLAPFGFSRDAALAYIIAAQAVIYAVVIVWGALGLWALGFRRSGASSLVAHPEEAAQEVGTP